MWERAETLRRGVEALRIEWEGHLLPVVTVSVGMALFPAHGNNGHDLIQAADMALYQAKLQGRNCSVLYIPGTTPQLCPSEVR
jgi:diguanylate cyclase (GGDEF)-like protein